jgi:hypothetical protein
VGCETTGAGTTAGAQPSETSQSHCARRATEEIMILIEREDPEFFPLKFGTVAARPPPEVGGVQRGRNKEE